MVLWDSPGHVMWNGAMALVCVAAIVALLHPRSRPLRQGWLSKALWILPLFITFWVAGYALPLGPILVLRQLRIGWREVEVAR